MNEVNIRRWICVLYLASLHLIAFVTLVLLKAWERQYFREMILQGYPEELIGGSNQFNQEMFVQKCIGFVAFNAIAVGLALLLPMAFRSACSDRRVDMQDR